MPWLAAEQHILVLAKRIAAVIAGQLHHRDQRHIHGLHIRRDGLNRPDNHPKWPSRWLDEHIGPGRQVSRGLCDLLAVGFASTGVPAVAKNIAYLLETLAGFCQRPQLIKLIFGPFFWSAHE